MNHVVKPSKQDPPLQASPSSYAPLLPEVSDDAEGRETSIKSSTFLCNSSTSACKPSIFLRNLTTDASKPSFSSALSTLCKVTTLVMEKRLNDNWPYVHRVLMISDICVTFSLIKASRSLSAIQFAIIIASETPISLDAAYTIVDRNKDHDASGVECTLFFSRSSMFVPTNIVEPSIFMTFGILVPCGVPCSPWPLSCKCSLLPAIPERNYQKMIIDSNLCDGQVPCCMNRGGNSSWRWLVAPCIPSFKWLESNMEDSCLAKRWFWSSKFLSDVI